MFNSSPYLDKKKSALNNLRYTLSHAQHQLRRQALEPFFSRGNIMTLEFVIRNNIDKLRTQLKLARESSSPANISLLYRCLTADFIIEYCFGHNYGFLEDPEGSRPFFGGCSDGFKQVWLMHEVKPWERLTTWATLLPERLLPAKGSRVGTLLHVFQRVKQDARQAGRKRSKDGNRRPISTELPKNEKLPPSERTELIIYHTVLMLIGAGLETTGHVLETSAFHLNASESAHMLKRLKDEVAEI